MQSKSYTVRIELSITADSPEEAAELALQDLRDETLGPWNMDVDDIDDSEAEPVSVEVG